MKAKCIKRRYKYGSYRITVGKEYNIEDETKAGFKIVNDKGELRTYPKGYFKLIKKEMEKMIKPKELTPRHVVKLRGYGNCIIAERKNTYGNGTHFSIYNKKRIGELIGIATLNAYNSDFKHITGLDYDIMATKEFDSASEAIGAVINEEEISWDWEREELIEINSLDELEEVRKKLCEKYNKKGLYITNRGGNWRIAHESLMEIYSLDLEGEGYKLNI